jgi:hypothetical protein
MLASAVPGKFNIPFANAAGGSFIRAIPQASQIGITNGAASLTDGFPPDTFSPIAAGGVPPFGQDFNGLLNQITLWNQWQSAGGPIIYDGTFATAIGGYPKGAMVQSAVTVGLFFISLVDSNSTNPDSGGTNWIVLGETAGAMQFRPTSETLAGYVVANGLTLGSASSGATGLAAANAVNLFAWLWSNFSNTQCPVSGGRGASAAADFAANKTIATLDWRGRGFVGTDGMGNGTSGRLASVPVTSGSVTTPGSILGENLHALITAELAVHNHSATDAGHTHSVPAPSSTASSPSFSSGPFSNYNSGPVTTGTGFASISVTNTGSGTAHNNVSLSYTGYVYLKL